MDPPTLASVSAVKAGPEGAVGGALLRNRLLPATPSPPSSVACLRARNEADSSSRHNLSSPVHGFFGTESIIVLFHSISTNWLWGDASLVSEKKKERKKKKKSPWMRDYCRAERNVTTECVA